MELDIIEVHLLSIKSMSINLRLVNMRVHPFRLAASAFAVSLIGLLSIVFLTAASSQERPAQDDTVIKVDVSLVNILCSVHNKGNGLVGNLEQKDFQIFED